MTRPHGGDVPSLFVGVDMAMQKAVLGLYEYDKVGEVLLAATSLCSAKACALAFSEHAESGNCYHYAVLNVFCSCSQQVAWTV